MKIILNFFYVLFQFLYFIFISLPVAITLFIGLYVYELFKTFKKKL